MGCAFCATGIGGLSRDLGPGEMVDQVRLVADDFGRRVTNAVAMGQGEPFANYDATLGALRFMNSDEGPGIGARHLTISTCGLIVGINRLAEEPEQFTLAVSLHSAVQATRDRLMPGVRALRPAAAAQGAHQLRRQDLASAVTRVRAHRRSQRQPCRACRSCGVLPRHAGPRQSHPGQLCCRQRIPPLPRRSAERVRPRSSRRRHRGFSARRARLRHRRRLRPTTSDGIPPRGVAAPVTVRPRHGAHTGRAARRSWRRRSPAPARTATPRSGRSGRLDRPRWARRHLFRRRTRSCSICPSSATSGRTKTTSTFEQPSRSAAKA